MSSGKTVFSSGGFCKRRQVISGKGLNASSFETEGLMVTESSKARVFGSLPGRSSRTRFCFRQEMSPEFVPLTGWACLWSKRMGKKKIRSRQHNTLEMDVLMDGTTPSIAQKLSSNGVMSLCGMRKVWVWRETTWNATKIWCTSAQDGSGWSVDAKLHDFFPHRSSGGVVACIYLSVSGSYSTKW